MFLVALATSWLWLDLRLMWHWYTDIFGVPTLLFLLVAGIIYGGYRISQKARIITDVPTSKTSGVTIGLNELKGRAECVRMLRAPLSEREVVYYHYTVEERWRRWLIPRFSDDNTFEWSGWEVLRDEERFVDFELHDDRGSIPVICRGAEVHGERVISKTCREEDPIYYEKGPSTSVLHSRKKRRFRETIVSTEEVYVIGTARVPKDSATPEIAEDETEDLFLISSKPEEKLVSKFTWWSRGLYFSAVALAVFIPFLGVEIYYEDVGTPPEVWDWLIYVMVASGLMGVAAVFGVYLKSTYNGLVDVRNRVLRARAMLEVEFQRRHELIPKLAQVVDQVASHEREVLETITELRSPSQFEQDCASGESEQMAQALDAQTERLNRLFQLTEKYGNLTSDGAFEKLMRELTICEDRLVLARQFYNDSVERANDRIGAFPDLLVARLAGVEEESYLQPATPPSISTSTSR